MTRASAPSGSSAAAGAAQAAAVAPELVQLAHSLADAAAAVTSRYFRTPVPVDVKSDASPVTIADKEAEAAMRQLIAQQVGGFLAGWALHLGTACVCVGLGMQWAALSAKRVPCIMPAS